MSRKQHVTVERGTGKHFGGHLPPSKRLEHIVQKELAGYKQKAGRHQEMAALAMLAMFSSASMAGQIDISAPAKGGVKAPTSLVVSVAPAVNIVEKSNPEHAGEIAMAEYEAWRNGEISTEDFLAEPLSVKKGLLAEWDGHDTDIADMFAEFSSLNPEERRVAGWSEARKSGLVEAYDLDDLAEENTRQLIFG